MSINRNDDVIIVGGGIAGLTCALALANSSLRIRVVDEYCYRPMENVPSEYHLRVSAITPISARIFKKLGVWSEIRKMRSTSFREIEVWDRDGTAHIQFDSTSMGMGELGHIIENNIIQTALFLELQKKDNVLYDAPSKLTKLEVNQNEAIITLTDGRTLRSQIIIGADGAHSQIRELADLPLKTWDYHQQALIATIKTELPHQHIARQRFLETGPVAFLPLNDPYQCSIVWSHVPTQALQQLEKIEFEQALFNAFGSHLGRLTLISERQVFPLCMRHAQQYIQSRIALIGDAAHTIHPLAGQGLNLSIMDAVCLAEVLLTAKSEQRDIGLWRNLRRYERWRKGANITMLGIVEAFKQLFGHQSYLLSKILNMGMRVTDRAIPLKKWIMQKAMGFSSDLPSIISNTLMDDE